MVFRYVWTALVRLGQSANRISDRLDVFADGLDNGELDITQIQIEDGRMTLKLEDHSNKRGRKKAR